MTLDIPDYGISHAMRLIKQEACRPSVLFKPNVYRDGNMWCALYGDDSDVATRVCGFGKSPCEAVRAFDTAWIERGKTND